MSANDLLTMVFGATNRYFCWYSRFTQYDIKRVVAYLLCSQLGYMVLICGGASFTLEAYFIYLITRFLKPYSF